MLESFSKWALLCGLVRVLEVRERHSAVKLDGGTRKRQQRQRDASLSLKVMARTD